MFEDIVPVVTRLAGALAIGAIIGFERSFHGRPAGFRTHSLVCVASTLLMLVTVFQHTWMTAAPADSIRTDPTRMAQGIMTGIGFLGAGVIFKEGLTVRGLTTAASIWVTSAIGILVGIGFYGAAAAGTAATLMVLSGFRVIERRLPREFYAHHRIKFRRDDIMAEEDLRALVARHGFTIANLLHRLGAERNTFEYRMMLRGRDRLSAERLSRHLRNSANVIEFEIAPTGE